MKIRWLKDYAWAGRPYKVGEECEMPNQYGEPLVRHGHAELVDEKKPAETPASETATADDPDIETATVKRPRRIRRKSTLTDGTS